jgi:hypothetical protein
MACSVSVKKVGKSLLLFFAHQIRLDKLSFICIAPWLISLRLELERETRSLVCKLDTLCSTFELWLWM